jgi:multidrug transporter EmrE-like cation transporter
MSAVQGRPGDLAVPTSATRTPVSSVVLILLCTGVGAAAQILMREGANYLPAAGDGGLALSVLTNWPLLAGYACLGLNTGLLVLALRKGQLSVLYPIIALTYVWVAILSPMFFEDSMNFLKVLGIALIVGGVSLIGVGSRQ